MLNTQLKAVIFDLDGVLVDTSIFHGRAWKKLVEDLGHTPPHDLEERVKGISRMASLKIALGDNARNYSDAELAALADKKNHYYLSLTKTISPADLYDGVLELFADLKSTGIKVVLGSASKNAKPILDSLGITSYFDAIADGFTYKHGKPHPDVFLTGAGMVGAKPWECIVVEDAAAGITAALDGGFATVAMGNYTSLKHAHLYVQSLRDLSASRLSDLQARYRSDRWTFVRDGIFGGQEPSVQTIFSIGNGLLGIRGDLAALSDKPRDASTPSFLDVRFTLDCQRVSFAAGTLKSLRRTLDLRSGIFTADALWQAPDGKELRLVERRLADMAKPERVLIQYELEAMNFSGPVTIEAGINTDATFDMDGLPQCMHKVTKKRPADPRGYVVEAAGKPDGTAIAIAGNITIHDRPDATYQVRDEPAGIYVVAKTQLQQGQLLYVERCVLISNSHRVADPFAHITAELTAAAATTLGQARIESTARWQEQWNASDIVIESDRDDQLATRFNTFAKTALPWLVGNKDYTVRCGEPCDS